MSATHDCGACGRHFPTLADVFDHECEPARPTGSWRSMPSAIHATMPLATARQGARSGTATITAPRDDRPTERQTLYLRSLLTGREGIAEAETVRATLNAHREAGTLTRRVVSSAIDTLTKVARPTVERTPTHELADGIYRNATGEVVKVYHAVHGSGQQVAKVLRVTGHGEGTFEYAGKAPLRSLTEAMRMTLAEATEFGSLYGICCNCSRTLTDERSIAAGMGPICSARFTNA